MASESTNILDSIVVLNALLKHRAILEVCLLTGNTICMFADDCLKRVRNPDMEHWLCPLRAFIKHFIPLSRYYSRQASAGGVTGTYKYIWTIPGIKILLG